MYIVLCENVYGQHEQYSGKVHATYEDAENELEECKKALYVVEAYISELFFGGKNENS